MQRYQVIVGNIGTVYDGNSRGLADCEFTAFCKISDRMTGRAAGESVTLMDNDEPVKEYTGKLDLASMDPAT